MSTGIVAPDRLLMNFCSLLIAEASAISMQKMTIGNIGACLLCEITGLLFALERTNHSFARAIPSVEDTWLWSSKNDDMKVYRRVCHRVTGKDEAAEW
jgi:hypothetical protein